MTTRNTYYLYTDATLHPIFKKNKVVADHGIPYIGGLITDNHGKILFNFFEKINNNHGKILFNFFEKINNNHGKINNTLIKKNITYIEAMAIEIGLEHANEMGIKNIVCTTDSSNCVYMIQKILMNQKINTYSKNPFNEKFYDIIAIADEFFNSFEIRHMKRDNNHYADYLQNAPKSWKQTFATFSPEEQKRLAKVFKDLSDRGCYVMLSNHNTSLVNELYKDYNIHVIEAKRSINSKGNKRGRVEEVIITNYENNMSFDENEG